MSPTDFIARTGRLRRWVVRASWIVGAACICTLIAIGRGAPILQSSSAAPAPSAGSDAGSDGFTLSDAQLRSIGSEIIKSADFYTQIVTDGKLAYNADRLTTIYSPYSGRVVRVIAALGSKVRRGDALFELDASEYAQAQSDLLTAAAQVKLNSAIEQRKSAQYQAQAASLQDWEQSQNDLSASRAALAAVRSRLHILGKTDAEIDAMLDQAQAPALVTVNSPIDGMVIDRQIGPGQFLQAASATPVYTVADLSTVWLVANVREADAGAVRVGQLVRVHVPALPSLDLQARVTYVAPAVDPGSRRVVVHALLDNRDGQLKAEMFASLVIATSAVTQAPAVPSQAVIYEGDQARVWVVRAANQLSLRRIRLGRTLDDRIEVLAGLAVGDRVVTRGAIFIDRAAAGS